MSIIKDPQYLPVFHHIAKNAGTYVLSWAQMLCRRYHLMRGDNLSLHWTSAKIRRALIRLKDGRQLTIIYCTLTDLTGDTDGIFSLHPELEQFSRENNRNIVLEKQMEYINNRYPIDSDATTNIIPEDDFLNFIEAGDIVPFCVIVDPIFWGGLKTESNCSGWKCARIFIDLILSFSGRKHPLHFSVLRNPYDRALSIFNYIKSDNSSHEPNHDCLISQSFQEYIESDELEDSWFLRNLLDMPEDQVIEPYHLTLADEWLSYFRISDTSKVDDLINDVFHGAYGILQSDVEERVVESNLHRNATPNKLKIKFEDLDPTIQQKFLDRTYWDRKLWERYCKNVDIS
jgi:hypothetical protein